MYVNIYERLVDDHDRQKGLLAGIVDTEGDSSERRRLFDLLKVELAAHAAAEEQVFYAELMSEPDGQDKARHSVAEHQTASEQIKDLEEMDMSSSAWLPAAKKLQREIVHHVDEEEREVFPLAKTLLEEGRAVDMAQEFQERKRSEEKSFG
jgi:hemerythrin-like domain-containing protein